MKFQFFLFLISFSTFSSGAPCNGAPGKYFINPDGSSGGFIQNGSVVEKNNFISVDSEVCNKAIIRGKNIIQNGSVIRENVIIEGSTLISDSQLYGYAKIKGRAFIQNSVICQGSLIEGIKVIDSNYYCQTEDPQPIDPGEAGRKSILGVDSDGDGVRDDIEVFINQNYSNTPSRNFKTQREATKLYAKALQLEVLAKDSKDILNETLSFRLDIKNCFEGSLYKDVFASMYDTQDRILLLFQNAGKFHGEIVRLPSGKCGSISDFSIRLSKIDSKLTKSN